MMKKRKRNNALYGKRKKNYNIETGTRLETFHRILTTIMARKDNSVPGKRVREENEEEKKLRKKTDGLEICQIHGVGGR